MSRRRGDASRRRQDKRTTRGEDESSGRVETSGKRDERMTRREDDKSTGRRDGNGSRSWDRMRTSGRDGEMSTFWKLLPISDTLAFSYINWHSSVLSNVQVGKDGSRAWYMRFAQLHPVMIGIPSKRYRLEK